MLEQVKNAEDNAFRTTGGKDTKDMYYQTVIGLNQVLTLSQTAGAQKDQVNGSKELEATVERDDHSSADSSESEFGTDEDGSSSEAEVPWAPLDKKGSQERKQEESQRREEGSQKEQNFEGCEEEKEETGKSSQNQVTNRSNKDKVLWDLGRVRSHLFNKIHALASVTKSRVVSIPMLNPKKLEEQRNRLLYSCCR